MKKVKLLAKLESNRDFMDAELKSNRAFIESIHRETLEVIKDFHGRLCAIEERRKN